MIGQAEIDDMAGETPQRTPKTNFEKVQDFQAAAKFKTNVYPLSKEEFELHWKAIMSEVNEFAAEAMPALGISQLTMKPTFDFTKVDIPKLSKELADVLYVCYGFADKLGLPMDEIFSVVHESNMTKTVTPEYEGKNYVPPDLSWVLKGERVSG
jgi:predicted HAD superfamily Cof-like phosphohydrolase